MAVQLEDRAWRDLMEMRIVRSPWRLRGLVGGVDVIDTRGALLVWEPRRVTPAYAVPVEDVEGVVEHAGAPRALTHGESSRPVLDPSVPFDAHTVLGEALRIHTTAGVPVDAFRIEDPQLEGFVVVDFDGLDWFEEETPQLAHPRDPYHRIDTHPTTRRVRISVDGETVAESTRAVALFESGLPPRFYLPAEDVRADLLEPSETTTRCAYKGVASYWHLRVEGALHEDLAWTYEEPSDDGRAIRGLICFFNERVDLEMDGHVQERPVTQWSH